MRKKEKVQKNPSDTHKKPQHVSPITKMAKDQPQVVAAYAYALTMLFPVEMEMEAVDTIAAAIEAISIDDKRIKWLHTNK